ncbi:alpha/beta hydrolase [Candidatus Desantisbacteria bacterium]|nr:alpha/beta hydrolase [Candidatus Desantisbacteria bacterium]
MGIHGTRDEIVPISLAEKLFNEANAPKKFMPVYGAGHNDIYEWDNGVIFQVIAGFLKGVL